MTTYTLNSNIRSGDDSDVQHVTVGDTVEVTVLSGYTPTVSTLVNCSASRVVTNGSSSYSSTLFTVTPTSGGAYSALLYQPYQANTYTLTGSATGSAGTTIQDTKFLTVGTYFSATGYGNPYHGNIYETIGGGADTTLTDLYAGSSVRNLYYNTSSNTLTLQINDAQSNVVNNVWDYLTIDGNTFTRFEATFTQVSAYKTWTWTSVSNPFPSNGNTIPFTFYTGSLTYQFAVNIRTGTTHQTATKNVVAGDTIITDALTSWAPAVAVNSLAPVNCTASVTVTNPGVASNTVFTVVPTGPGAYSARFGSAGRSFTLSGTSNAQAVGGITSGTVDFGFEQYDVSGNVVVDSREATETFLEIATGLSIYLLPPNVGTSTYDWTGCTGVTSQADLDDNYVFERTDGGGWNLFVTEFNHTRTYISPGTVRFTWNGACRNAWTGYPITCTAFHGVTNVFNVLAIGKTL